MQYGYDAFGQRTAVTDTLGNVTTYGYDAVGRLITITQHVDTPRPSVTVNQYDAGDNLVRVTQNYLSGYPRNHYPPPLRGGLGGVVQVVLSLLKVGTRNADETW